MKILFTGASSFTGMWFIEELAGAGHSVISVFQRKRPEYEGLRKERVDRIVACSRPVFECSFGEEPFLDLLESEAWDVFCHHAAEVTDYKSHDFDANAALSNNTKNLKQVLRLLGQGGCHRVVLTGSVFEADEGAGEEPLRAFSAYGLSKTLTAHVFRFYCRQEQLQLGKFVIPNPFGPFEEPRFTAYLARHWREGKTPSVRTPDYVRDNIHVSLLAKEYKRFVESQETQRNPRGYVESQGQFATRFAREMEARWDQACKLEFIKQTDFSEPKMRVNTDPVTVDWNEKETWDELAEYYSSAI